MFHPLRLPPITFEDLPTVTLFPLFVISQARMFSTQVNKDLKVTCSKLKEI